MPQKQKKEGKQKGKRQAKKLKESRQASWLAKELVCSYNPTINRKIEILIPVWETMRTCDIDDGSQRTRKKYWKEQQKRKGRKQQGGRDGRGAAASAKWQVIVIPVILNTEDTEKETCKSEVKLSYTASPRALRSCLNKRNLFKEEERKAKWRWGWKAGSVKKHLPSTCRLGFDLIQQEKGKSQKNHIINN